MVKVCAPVLLAAAELEALAVVHTRTKSIRQIDRAARRAGRIASARAVTVKQKRVGKVVAAMERARGVQLRRDGDAYIADGYVRVRIDPPECSCRGWELRWRSVPLAGKRAKRVPCIHLVAVAVSAGMSDPAEILSIANRALG